MFETILKCTTILTSKIVGNILSHSRVEEGPMKLCHEAEPEWVYMKVAHWRRGEPKLQLTGFLLDKTLAKQSDAYNANYTCTIQHRCMKLFGKLMPSIFLCLL